MRKRIKKTLLGILSCGLVTAATFGVGAGMGVTASAASKRVEPTGLNETQLTQEIDDSDLETFQVYGASTRKSQPVGFRFLTTIAKSDLKLIPKGAEFGLLLMPANRVEGVEMTAENSSKFPALVDTDATEVPDGGLGYYITLMGKTLEEAFPENLYNTVFAARAYVKYEYTANGETVVDYAYSDNTVYRSIAYVASCELTAKEGGDIADPTTYLNKVVERGFGEAALTLSESTVFLGETVDVSLENATDGVNAYRYNLSSANTDVVVVTDSGELRAVGVGTSEITATIGANTIKTTITVNGAETFTGGNILYSTRDGGVFLPDGLLDEEGEEIVSATAATGDCFNQGTWSGLALNDSEIKGNAVRTTELTVRTSCGDLYTVTALSYMGVIDELSDFPAFFNNTAVPSEFNAATYPAVAPNTYGYYIVAKDLGTGTETLEFSQTIDTDYQKTNGFNGVLDGAGHTLKFKLVKGGLVGYVLGNAVIKNIAVIYEDASGYYDSTNKVMVGEGYGVFGYITNGSPEIRNSYIQRTNNLYHQGSVFGIMGRPNARLILRNTAVYGYNTSNQSGWYNNMWISSASENAYLIYARSNATGWTNVANFTEVSTSNALTNDLSTFDTNYWRTDNNQLNWKGLADMAVSEYEQKFVTEIDETALYSTDNTKMILPEGLLANGETVVDAKGENNTDFYENGAWQNLALTTDEINANETKTTVITIETSKGYFYRLPVTSYAGVIEELADFATFFNNDPTATAPSKYGYYVVTKDMGTTNTELALTQSEITDGAATCGFNGVLDGQGHTVQFKLTSGGLVGLVLGNATIKNLGVIFFDASFSEYVDSTTGKMVRNGGYGAFGYITSGAPVIDNCYVERTNNVASRSTVFGLMARPNAQLVLKNTLVYGYYVPNDCTWWSTTVNCISPASTNAYVINGRANANTLSMAANFTKVYNDALENATHSLPLEDVDNVNGFDGDLWYKDNNSIIWKGFERVFISWVYDDDTVVQAVTKGHAVKAPVIDAVCWSSDAEGANIVELFRADKDATYYAIYNDIELSESGLYSTVNNEFFLPTGVDTDMDGVVTIKDAETDEVYYENGTWYKSFALSQEQIEANETTETKVKLYNGKINYYFSVKSYAGVIDDFADFATFFNNDPTAVAPDVYGYYIITKDLGSSTFNSSLNTYEYEDTLALEQTTITNNQDGNGFNGVLDGAGHTLKFSLKSGALVGMILGNATIQNMAILYADDSVVWKTVNGEQKWASGGYGVFGYITHSSPAIENCYIERTNNHFQKSTVYGLMYRPEAKLILRNTVVYGFNTNQNASWNANSFISSESKNAYVVCARSGMDNTATYTMSKNFTKVYANGSGYPYDTEARKVVAMADITDASKFNDCWSKETNLTWKGADDMQVANVGAINVQETYLVEKEQTKYAIVLPTGADDILVAAKDELIALVQEATGATLTVANDAAYDTYGTYISIGDTQMFEASGLSKGEMSGQGYQLQMKDNAIFINGGSSIGCLHGVYGLMKTLFDFEQFSEDTYALTKKTSVELPTLTGEVVNPDIEMRMPSNGALKNDENYADRMGMGLGENELFFPAGDYVRNDDGNKATTTNEGWRVWHNTLEILPLRYWYDGKPIISKGTTPTAEQLALSKKWFAESKKQLCYTAHGDGKAYDMMVEQIAEVLKMSLGSETVLKERPNAKYITITSEDGSGVCTCGTCKAKKEYYGSDVGAVIKLCNDVSDKIQAWLNTKPTWAPKEVKILFFAYNDYVMAPTKNITMNKNVGVMYAVSDYVNYYYDVYNTENDDFRAQFDAWAALTNESGSDLCMWTYTKNFAAYMLRADVYGGNAFFNENAYSYFASKGVDLWFNQGATDGTTTLSAFEKLNGYLDSQLMWDSTQSVTALTDKWFTAMYGAAADIMKTLYSEQNTAARDLYGTKKEGIPTVAVTNGLSALVGTPYAPSTLTKALLERWIRYIEEARAAVNGDEKLLANINEEWISVKFWQMYLYKSSYNITTAQNEFRAVLGYDASTGKYAKNVKILESSDTMLSTWINDKFATEI